MTAPPTGRDPLEELAEEFLARYRTGERPPLSEFTVRRPDLADRIRQVFPTLILMEQLGPPPDADRPAAPERLGEYRIVREVGRGGMGVVYEAVQESLGRRVALKVLPADRGRGPLLERFWREARSAARLHHTNIVPVLGVGESGGVPYYAMQFIDGVSLAEKRPLSGEPEATAQRSSAVASGSPLNAVTEVARWGVQAAEALHHAHQQGVLHRDVKPSNLLLDAAGTLWVTDFGLAKAEGSDTLTGTGDLVGTLRYMAPERFRGQADARSDVYSLGATLYELLAQRPPFDDPDRLRLMDRITHAAPAPLRQVAPAVPRDLATIVHKAMAREPADRYATARELADDLGRFLADRPIRARPAGPVGRLVRWAKRHPAVASLSAAVVTLLAAFAAGGWWAAGRLQDQVAAVSAAQQETTDRLWDARLAQARAGRASRLPGQRFQSLAALAEAAAIRPALALRNEAAACLALVDVRDERRWAADLETDRLAYSTGVAFDPLLEHYAVTDAAGMIRVRAAADGREVARLTGAVGPADYLRFSPDGRFLAAQHTGGVWPLRVWDWRAGKVVLVLPATTSEGLSLDFHPDGRSVAVGAARGVDVYALPAGRRERTVPLDFAPAWLAFEPDRGCGLAVCGRSEPRLAALDADTGRVLAEWRSLPGPPYAAAWQPGGTLVAASAADGSVYVFDVATRAAPRPLVGHQLDAREVAFSPDGSLLVSRGWDATTRFWDPHGGRELLRARGASFLQFSRDGSRLAFRGYNTRELGVWEVAPRAECRLLYGHRGPPPQGHAGLAFAPGGRLLASTGGDGVCLWDTRTGRVAARLDTGPTRDVLFDPAGRYLVVAADRGVSVWPVRVTADADGVRYSVGPPWPTPLLACNRPFQLDASRDGDVAVVVDRFRDVLVFTPTKPLRRPVHLRGQANVSFAAVSPDGRWVATGTWRGTDVRVWDAAAGRPVATLPARESAGVTFTPDGGRLLVLESEGAYRTYRVPGWEPDAAGHDAGAGFTRGLRAAVHPDGRLMAQTFDRVNLRLVDLDSGGEVAVLAAPESENVAAYRFSPDGRFLAASTVRGVVQLWDLARLRAALGRMGLDWPGDVAPPPAAEDVGDAPVRVEVGTSLRGGGS